MHSNRRFVVISIVDLDLSTARIDAKCGEHYCVA